ncbi:lysine-specific demethylase 2A-like isoform X2 [Limulus polyphemus]|uniref:Lysine-specific demethylase 2A-like isoform X2 n=1 Tax=Limulus polyphemus TaxID=6850 RepID=A0ABM1B7X2_LIMPO|nr:lysine-specific demethylase 2A-like isoform X2 [Limulus polyphemus]
MEPQQAKRRLLLVTMATVRNCSTMRASESTSLHTKRVKERKHYTDDCLQDEEIEGRRLFSVEEKLASNHFGSFFVKEMKGEDFSLKYLQEHGLDFPLVFKEKSGLGMRMPSDNFTVNDVRQCVGSRRMLDVMDVTTQKDVEMSMKEWCKYFENTNRDKLLNVISLEFSHTRLEHYVESPTVVRQVDWVDWVWPQHLKESQTEATNVIEEMKYPKVQKYCLMSVKGCYTDFHIDFGGTSVWYHIIRGKKVFWLIPPTERNLTLYEQWVLSGKQGDVFFGDTVEKCARIELKTGYTFFIPAGWIHAVYTPEDTLVFGGNFLHNFAIERQLRIAEIEDATHVPMKFRYPFYTEMLWYVLQRYAHSVMGKNHLLCDVDGEPINPNESPPKKNEKNTVKLEPTCNPHAVSSDTREITDTKQLNPYVKLSHPHAPRVTSSKMDGENSPSVNGKKLNEISNDSKPIVTQKHLLTSSYRRKPPTEIANGELCEESEEKIVHLTQFELSGIKAVVNWLQRLPANKKCVPDLIANPEALLLDVKMLLQEHKNDNPQLACTGKFVLWWPESKKPKTKPRTSIPSGTKGKSGGKNNSNNNAKRRRTRCKKCEPCLRSDCGDCHFCKDMKKFGGAGRMKQSCISRQCVAPVLPHTACCIICGKDGLEKVNNSQDTDSASLMECSQCWEVVHPTCLYERYPELPQEGSFNDDLPNSWECPKCCRDGKPEQVKPRHMKSGRQKPPDTPRPAKIASPGEVFNNHTDCGNLETNSSTFQSIGNTVKHASGSTDVNPAKKKAKLECTNNQDKEEGDSSSIQKVNIVKKPEVIPSKKSLFISTDKDGEEIIHPSPPKRKSMFSEQYKHRCEELKKQATQAHVRSCTKYTLNIKSSHKSAGSKSAMKTSFQSSKQPTTEFCPQSLYSASGARKHGETARERLVRSLKGLKKNSEMRRHTVMKLKPRPSDNINVSGSKQDSTWNPREFTKCEVKVEKVDSNFAPKRLKATSGLHNNDEAEKNIPRHAPRITMTLRDKPNLSKSKYVVRPGPFVENLIEIKKTLKVGFNSLALKKDVMLPVFHYLSASDLFTCQLVCKTWNRWTVDPRLWTYMDFSRKKITATILMGIVRRQPISLNLSWTNISQRQLSWLIARLPQLKALVLNGCSTAAVSSLCTCYCPLLSSLDISWVEGLTDTFIRELLSNPPDSRPGCVESKTRLHKLQEVRLAGADISDVSVRLLAHHLSLLSCLDMSNCHKVTDMGIAVLGAAKSNRLTVLDVSSCANISNTSLEALRQCSSLSYLDMRECPQVTEDACQKFVNQSQQKLITREEKLIEKYW